jgi:predicted secreted protein
MDWAEGITVYVILWWVLIFTVLPWGVEPLDEKDVKKGQDAGAPKNPHLLRKVLATTFLSAIVWLIIYWTIDSGAVSLR